MEVCTWCCIPVAPCGLRYCAGVCLGRSYGSDNGWEWPRYDEKLEKRRFDTNSGIMSSILTDNCVVGLKWGAGTCLWLLSSEAL